MKRKTGEPIVALEVGTAKTVLLAAEPRDDHDITVRALAVHPTAGMRKGQVEDYENAEMCLREAMRRLETDYPIPDNRVILSLSGPHIQTSRNRGHTVVLNDQQEVTDEDIRHVKQVARTMNLPEDRVVMHTLFGRYMLDDEQSVLRPEGMVANKMAVDMLAIHGSKSLFRNHEKLACDLGLQCRATVFSGYAAALAVLRAEHRRSGVVVIDLGAGTTDYIAYANEVVAAAGVLGVGGDHVTNDLSLAFGLTHRDAERLKCEHGAAMPERTTKATIIPGELSRRERTIPLASLRTVIHARMQETFQLIKRRLDEQGVLDHVGAGICLTGGGASLLDVDDLAESVFGKPCQLARPWGIHGYGVADRSDLATVAGLVRYGLRMGSESGARSGMIEYIRSLWSGSDDSEEDDAND